MSQKNKKYSNLSRLGSGLEVKQSQIPNAGYGLYASINFKQNDYITIYEGKIITKKEADEITKKDPERRSHMRSLQLGQSVIDGKIDPIPGKGGASFANDANNTNFKNNSKFVTKFINET